MIKMQIMPHPFRIEIATEVHNILNFTSDKGDHSSRFSEEDRSNYNQATAHSQYYHSATFLESEQYAAYRLLVDIPILLYEQGDNGY